MFPKLTLNNNDFHKLKLSTDALYSVSLPNEANIITKIIKQYYPHAKTIADMNANVGGNSINFCNQFNFVYSTELNKYTSQLLENNLNVYNFKNFKVINEDCMKFNKHADVYFYDPQWTGIFYGMNKIMNLYYGTTDVTDVLKHNFCIKVPNNFNVYNLLQKFPNIHIHKVRNFMVIVNHVSNNLTQSNKKTLKHNNTKHSKINNTIKNKHI